MYLFDRGLVHWVQNELNMRDYAAAHVAADRAMSVHWVHSMRLVHTQWAAYLRAVLPVAHMLPAAIVAYLMHAIQLLLCMEHAKHFEWMELVSMLAKLADCAEPMGLVMIAFGLVFAKSTAFVHLMDVDGSVHFGHLLTH